MISSEGNPSILSGTSYVFEQKSPDLEQANLFQSEVNDVFDIKGNQSTSNVPDQNLYDQELSESSQTDALDFFGSENVPSTAAFGHMSADPFPNDIFASVSDNTSTDTFSVETTQRTANPFDDFSGLEVQGEAAETQASNFFPDDIFSSYLHSQHRTLPPYLIQQTMIMLRSHKSLKMTRCLTFWGSVVAIVQRFKSYIM